MHKIKGASLIGMLFVIVVLISVGFLAVKILPPIVENYQLQDSLKILARDPGVMSMSEPKLKDALERKLEVNNIRNFKTSAVEIKNEDQLNWLVVKYTVTVPLLENVDVVLKFNNRVMVEQK